MFALWAVGPQRVSRKLALFPKLDAIWVTKSLMKIWRCEWGSEEGRFSRAHWTVLQGPQVPCEALEELGVVWRECPISQAFSSSFRAVLPVINYHVLPVFQALVYLVMGLFPAEPWVRGTQLYVLGEKGQEGTWAPA